MSELIQDLQGLSLPGAIALAALFLSCAWVLGRMVR